MSSSNFGSGKRRRRYRLAAIEPTAMLPLPAQFFAWIVAFRPHHQMLKIRHPANAVGEMVTARSRSKCVMAR